MAGHSSGRSLERRYALGMAYVVGLLVLLQPPGDEKGGGATLGIHLAPMLFDNWQVMGRMPGTGMCCGQSTCERTVPPLVRWPGGSTRHRCIFCSGRWAYWRLAEGKHISYNSPYRHIDIAMLGLASRNSHSAHLCGTFVPPVYRHEGVMLLPKLNLDKMLSITLATITTTPSSSA